MGWFRRRNEEREGARLIGTPIERRPECRNSYLRLLNETDDGETVAGRNDDETPSRSSRLVKLGNAWYSVSEVAAARRFLVQAGLLSSTDVSGCNLRTIRITPSGELCIQDYNGDVALFLARQRRNSQGEDSVSFASAFQRISTKATIVRTRDGNVERTPVDASIQGRKASFEIGVDIEEGDVIEQVLPNGRTKQHTVLHVAYHERPAHMAHVTAEIEPTTASTGTPGPLRILYLTASAAGDLRVDQEVRRVNAAVRTATGRDLVSIEHLPAVTGGDLLDGLTRFRPQVIHFSGHADAQALVFDTGRDSKSLGIHLSAESFAAALEAVDRPPALVVLNACNSEPQLQRLLGSASVAVGMSDSIGDAAAIAFAARFYAAITDGQSVRAAFRIAKVQMEIDGLPDADLPALAEAVDGDAARLVLVPAEPRP